MLKGMFRPMAYALTPDNSTPWMRLADPERKKAYAAFARTRPDDVHGRYEAACLTFPDQVDDNLARQAALEYKFDRVVIEETERLAAEEPEAGLPSKAQQARDIYNLTQQATTIDDKLKAHKLYADIMGHVQRPSDAPVGNNTYIDNRSVILLPRRETNIDDWERDTIEHQAQLVSNATK